MPGVVAAGVAAGAFILGALLQLSSSGDPRLQALVVYLGFAALSIAVFDIANRLSSRGGS
jgi:hypothetical protein